ncbi:MAG: hypothetical protein Q4F61_03095 [Candidatus Saccharibacteria bacterium]|nr:hypothetical protein [Candidatus Saccharibacteria bacterium]
MTEKINKNQGRIIETTSSTDGNIEKNDDFWSIESLRKRPISEQYPKLENETDDHYNARLQEIQDLTELAQANLTKEDKREIENGAYTEKSGKSATPNYKKFGVNALRAFDMAEKNPGLFHSDEGEHELNERRQAQENKANYYIELYQKNQPELSEFSGLVPADKLARDKSYLREKEEKIIGPIAWEDPEKYERDEHVKIWDRLAEAVLYPLTLNFGLFDNNIIGSGEESSGQRRARAIYPSRYDDLRHGVDTAFMIPTNVDKRGKIRYVPVTFDCTTSTDMKVVAEKFDKVGSDGRTRIDYSKTEDDDLMVNICSLNFIIGVDRDSLAGDEGLMRGDNIAHPPKAFFHDIYAQIHIQAKLRANYYKVLQYERAKSKKADVLSKDELLNLHQAIAVRDFFAQKCKETATDKEHPFFLSHTYNKRSPVFLVTQNAAYLSHIQRIHIGDVKKEKGWE